MPNIVQSERDRNARFYEAKWGDHQGYWGEHYPRWALPYSRMYAVRNAEVRDRVPRGLRRLLDVGCGVGDNLADLADLADELLGVDPAPANVERAHANMSRSGCASRIELARAEDLPFEDGWVDCVLMLDVIEHVTDRPRALREVERVLAPGGTLICVTPVARTLHLLERLDRVLGAPVHAAVKTVRRWRGTYVDSDEAGRPFEEFLSEPELRVLVTGAGLAVREQSRVCFYPGPEGGGAFLHVARALTAGPGGTRIRAAVVRLLEAIERRERFNQKQIVVAAKPH